MRVKDAAAKLEISVSLCYLLIAEGKLGCTRHGIGRGTIRISDAHLADYVALAEGADASRRQLKFIR